MSGDDKDQERGPSGREAIDEISARLRGLIDGVAAAFKAAEKEGGASGRAESESGGVKTETGWSVRLGGLELGGDSLDGLKERAGAPRWGVHPGAARRATASRRPAPKKPTEPAPAPRAAHVEVFDEADAVIVTAELPGVVADDVELTLDGAVLKIRAGGARPFAADAALPDDVDPTAEPDMRLANGVLEARLPKRSDTD